MKDQRAKAREIAYEAAVLGKNIKHCDARGRNWRPAGKSGKPVRRLDLLMALKGARA